MRAKLSPLIWLNFALLKSEFDFIQPTTVSKRKLDPSTIFEKYIIDVDFSNNISDDGTFQTFTKIEINNEDEPEAGYKILVEGTGIFQIKTDVELPEGHIKNLQNYSAVNLLINRLRTHILQMTSLSVFGAYDLPPIDITDLFRQKNELNK
ncbi:MAG: preprotein translocase subunit SecB [Flavobacterium sp.]|nr:MAG: preprotein translocase subunit SecB [Flavobacterium sp.]